MDERESHVDEQDYDYQSDVDINDEDETTPEEDTDGNGEPRTTKAEEARLKQKERWLNDIRDGKRSLDDMPDNLNWLRKDPDFDEYRDQDQRQKSEPKSKDELDQRVQNALRAQREKEDFELMIDFLATEDIPDDKMASVREFYQDYKSEGLSEKKALETAMRLSGIKDIKEVIADRRRQGMSFPPRSGKRRSTVSKDKDDMTKMEKKFMDSLPPGFIA